MFKESLTCAFLVWLKDLFLLYKESAIYNFIMKIANGVKSHFEKSFTRNHIVKKSGFESMYETSLFYAFFSALINAIVLFFEKIYSFIFKKGETSLTNCIFEKFHSTNYFRYEYLLGAFFVFMLIIPGQMWNNAYAAVGAVFFTFLYFLVRISGRNFGTDFKKIPMSFIAFAIASTIIVLPVPGAPCINIP